MKKLLFLLLFPIFGYAQVHTDAFLTNRNDSLIRAKTLTSARVADQFQLAIDSKANQSMLASYQLLSSKLTAIAALANASGYLRNDGSGNFSYATPSGGSVIGGIKVQSYQPTDTTAVWVDKGNSYAGMYPVRRYVSGEWQKINPDMPYYDPLGKEISNGRPLCVLWWGQSNVGTSSYLNYINPIYGDTTKNNNIHLWNWDAGVWTIPNPAYPPSGGTSDNWSWRNGFGTNSVQTFAKLYNKQTGRAVKIVQVKVSGTSLACWESTATPTGDCYSILLTQAAASGIPYFDLIAGQHGEGGLSGGGFTSAYSSYQASLYGGIMSGLRSQSYCDANTAFIMTSPGTSAMIYGLGGEPGYGVEMGIRNLSTGRNTRNAWARRSNPIKEVQANSSGATTSSTSVNLSTVASGVTITIPTGLPNLYSGTGGVVVISRSTKEYFTGGANYVSGTGALTITADYWSTEFQVFGTSTKTDWDVLVRDPLHLTTREEMRDGEAIFNTYLSIINNGARPGEHTFQVTDTYNNSGNNISKQVIVHPTSDNTQEYFKSTTINAGTIHQVNYISNAGALGLYHKYVGGGSASRVYETIAANTSGVTTDADAIQVLGYFGTQMPKPLYFASTLTLNTATDSRIQLGSGSSGKTLELTGATSGSLDGRIDFKLGNNIVFDLYEGSGNPYRKTVGAAIINDSDISPTALASNTDNYAPTGIGYAITLRISATTPIDLTGIAGGTAGVTFVDGRELTLINVGTTNTITLKNDVTSTAANRFLLNADFPLAANMAIKLVYDGTASRWRKVY